MNSPDVLIIDDDDLVRGTIRDMLEEEGHSVAEAGDGKTGIEVVGNQRPRLVICDVRMPGMNGYEVLQAIRGQPEKFSDPSFIFLSGLNDKQFVKAGYMVGADDYMTKPVDYDVLLMKVGAMLRKRSRYAPSKPAPLTTNDKTEDTALAVPEEFKSHLARLMKTEGPQAASRLNLVTLEGFRERFGDRWEKLRGKAMAIADGVVRDALGKKDFYVRYGDDSFLILLDGTELEASQRRAENLAVEIRHRLLGKDKDFNGFGITADTIDVSKVAAKNVELTPQMLAGAFDARAAKLESVEKSGETGGDATWFKEQLSTQFRPLWSPSRQMVVAFQCYPFRRSSYGVFSGEAVLNGGDQDSMAVCVDAVMAAQAVKRLQGRQTGTDPVLLLPLHFATLKAKGHGGLEAIFKGVPQNLLSSRLAIEIVGIPENRDERSIRQVVDIAKRMSSRISVQLQPDDRHARLFKATGAESLMLDIESDWQTQSEKQILMRLLDFGQRAKAQGFHTAVYGLNSIASVRKALEIGINLAGGRVIGDVRDAPAQIYELTRKYILS